MVFAVARLGGTVSNATSSVPTDSTDKTAQRSASVRTTDPAITSQDCAHAHLAGKELCKSIFISSVSSKAVIFLGFICLESVVLFLLFGINVSHNEPNLVQNQSQLTKPQLIKTNRIR